MTNKQKTDLIKWALARKFPVGGRIFYREPITFRQPLPLDIDEIAYYQAGKEMKFLLNCKTTIFATLYCEPIPGVLASYIAPVYGILDNNAVKKMQQVENAAMIHECNGGYVTYRLACARYGYRSYIHKFYINMWFLDEE